MADKKSPKTLEINLLPGDDLEQKPGGKFLKWALTWGKRIVISTEAIVILAFLSRFWLDTTVADLADQITTRKNVIVASQNFENTFRNTTTQIAKVKEITDTVSPLTVWEKADLLLPSTVTVAGLSITPGGISLSGKADEQSLATLVSNFRNSPDFSDFTVDKISKTNPSVTIDFSMKATYTLGAKTTTK